MTSAPRVVPWGRAGVFAAVGTVATVVTGSLVVYRGVPGGAFPSRDVLVVVSLSATNAALLRWLGPVPVDALRGATPVTRRLRGASAVVGSLVVLAAVGTSGSYALVALATVALVVLAPLVRSLSRREIGWAVAFGAIAAVAGVAHGAGVERPDLVVSGVAQLPLVAVTLLAGWALARRPGWTARGIGPATALSGAPAAGLRSFLLGVLIATPWALGNVVGGPVAGDDVRAAWHPFAAALQPAVAEEAWARVFLVVLLYSLFRRHLRAGAALHGAAIVAMLWFAYLHAPADPLTVAFLAALYALPMTWLWLRRGLEAAIGFHFAVDLARYTAAYLVLHGIWFG